MGNTTAAHQFNHLWVIAKPLFPPISALPYPWQHSDPVSISEGIGAAVALVAKSFL